MIGWTQTGANGDDDVHARIFDPIVRGGAGVDRLSGTGANDARWPGSTTMTCYAARAAPRART